jgi:hypothetical protein
MDLTESLYFTVSYLISSLGSSCSFLYRPAKMDFGLLESSAYANSDNFETHSTLHFLPPPTCSPL